MREAKSLGIPLRQPGTGRAGGRRSLADSDSRGVGVERSCSRCGRTVTIDQPSTAPVLHKNASPFKDRFRIANLFAKKSKATTTTSKQALTLPRGHVTDACEVCGEVTGELRRVKTKYVRSASTPRPAEDGRLQIIKSETTVTNRPQARTRGTSGLTKRL